MTRNTRKSKTAIESKPDEAPPAEMAIPPGPPENYEPKSRMQIPGRLMLNAVNLEGTIASCAYNGQTHNIFMEGGGNVEIDIVDREVILIDSHGLDFSYYGGELTLISHTPGSPRTNVEQLTNHIENIVKDD